jgi:hypothetical protein
LKSLGECGRIAPKEMIMDRDSFPQNPRPACFGDEAKFIAYMETSAGDSECAKCSSEDECGEFILLKCSRELIF